MARERVGFRTPHGSGAVRVMHTARLEETLEFEALGLASPAAVAEALAPALEARGLRLMDLHGVVLRREVPALARYLVSARLRDDLVELAVIGKGVKRRSAAGEPARVLGLMRALWRGGFGEDRALTIPEPLALVPEPPMLLQAEVPGPTLECWLDDPLPAIGAVRLAGRWLAKLHAFDVGDLPPLAVVDEAAKLRACAERIGATHRGSNERSHALAQRLTGLLAGLDDVRSVLTHGDFQAGNIIIAENAVAAIDFDHAALAAPARDLGYFAAQALTRMYVRTNSMTTGWPWAAALREEYLRHRPDGDRGFSAYVARTILEVLYYRLGKSPIAALPLVPVWLDWCEEMLANAERELR